MSTSADQRGSKDLDIQGREVVALTYQYMKHRHSCSSNPNLPFDMTVTAMGLPRQTVLEVLTESDNDIVLDNYSTRSSSLIKRKPKPTIKDTEKLTISKFDMHKIRTVLLDMHVTNKYPSNLTELTRAINKKLHSKFNWLSLESQIRSLGFKNVGRHYFVEKNTVRLQRIRLVKELLRLRAEGKNIVYVYTNEFSEHSLAVAHAADAGTLCGDWLLPLSLSPFNSWYTRICDSYHSWLTKQLLPSLTEDSVLVLDKKSYEMMTIATPDWSTSKQFMAKWLADNDVDHDESRTKLEMFEMIKKYKSQYVEFKYGVPILLLPNSIPSLNPLESVWKELKTSLNNKKDDSTMTPAMVVLNIFTALTKKEWNMSVENAIQYEKQLLSEDVQYDNIKTMKYPSSGSESSNSCDSSDNDDI